MIPYIIFVPIFLRAVLNLIIFHRKYPQDRINLTSFWKPWYEQSMNEIENEKNARFYIIISVFILFWIKLPEDKISHILALTVLSLTLSQCAYILLAFAY